MIIFQNEYLCQMFSEKVKFFVGVTTGLSASITELLVELLLLYSVVDQSFKTKARQVWL